MSPLHHPSQQELSLQAPLVVRNAQSDGNSSVSTTVIMPPTTFLFRMFVASDVLQLSPETRFTAVVLLYRCVNNMYHHQQRQQNGHKVTANNQTPIVDAADWPWLGGACLFLACKAEEQNRRLRDIINMIFMVLMEDAGGKEESGDALRDAGNVGNVNLRVSAKPPPLDEEYWTAKKRVIDTEQAVLRWLGFDCHVSHPHRAVLLLLQDHSIPLLEELGNTIVSTSFRRINDALFLPTALLHSAVELACASIEIAIREVCGTNDTNDAPGTSNVHTLRQSEWWSFVKRIAGQLQKGIDASYCTSARK